MALTEQQKQAIIDKVKIVKEKTTTPTSPIMKERLEFQKSQQEPQEEEGIIASLAEPFMKGTASVQNLAETFYHIAKKDWKSAGESIKKERDYGILGKVRPIGIEQETGRTLTPTELAKDVVGTGVEAASWVAPASTAYKTVSGVAKPTIKGLATAGAISGSMGQAGAAAQDQMSVGEITLEGLKGATVGAIAGPIIGKTLQGATSLVKKFTKNTDDVINQVAQSIDTSKSPMDVMTKGATEVRKVAEETAPKLSIREKWAGVRPDIKKRIAGKGDLMQEYFDITHARNLDDTVPSAMDYGVGKYVFEARDKLDEVLNDVGSDIGKFREKVATYTPSRDLVDGLIDNFDNNLTKLNLSVKNGTINRLKGKVSSQISDSEIKVLQDLYNDILTISESPSLENLIDLRNAFDKKINYAKTAGEATNVIDPLSRNIRSNIASIGETIVGKGQAKNLATYSDLKGLSDELNQIVDSKSGAEFLLKRVLSERGRLPKELITELKKVTGIDLLDHATMIQIATDIIGNPAQQGLFRQEITKAGLDVADILTGGKVGAVKTLLQKGADIIAPKEEMFLKATGKKPLPKGKAVTTPAVSKVDTKIIVDSIRDNLSKLTKESKNYKSVNEFIKAQGKPIFHGTNAEFTVFDKTKIGSSTDEGFFGRGFYFGNTKDFAEIAPKGNRVKIIMEVYPDKNIKLFDISKIKNKNEMAELLNISEDALTQDSNGIIRPIRGQSGQFTSHVKDLGYDGVVVHRGGDAIETVIFEPDKIKTKSQLTEIWENANKK